MYTQFLDKHLFTFLADVQVSQASGHFCCSFGGLKILDSGRPVIVNFDILNARSLDYCLRLLF